MGKLTGSEKGMIFLSVLVLIACTVLAFLLGYVCSKEGGGTASHATPSEGNKTDMTRGENIPGGQEKEDKDCPPCPGPDNCPVPIPPERRFTSSISKLSTTPPEHNYVVSIIVPMYSDDRTNFMFVCTGVIISSDQVLTGNCGGDKDIMEMSIRAGSQYWHTGGSTHKIIAVTQPRFKASGLYILGVMPGFSTGATSVPVTALGDKWDEGKVIGWTKDPKVPKRNVKLDSTLETVSFDSLSCDGPECVSEKCDDSDVGRPLISTGGTPKLVGIISGRGCLMNVNLGPNRKHKFTDISAPNYLRWIQEMKHNTRRMFSRRRYY